jgi:hypothetical protein
MFPKGYRAREKAAKERSARRLVSPEVREARASILAAREEAAAGFEIGETTDVLSGRVATDADGIVQTVDAKPVAPMSTAIKPDGQPVLKVDGEAPDVAPKQNDNLASLPPVNEDETGDIIASQIASTTEGAPVPATVTDEAAPASAEAAKHPGEVEHGQETGETENQVDQHEPAQTAGGNTEGVDEAHKATDKPQARKHKARA